jgi:hypothetical protein
VATTTVVEDYIIKAIQRAEFEHLEDGGCTAWIPGFPGLVAVGRDGRDCLLDVWRRLSSWIQNSIDRDFELPVVGGINLNDHKVQKAAGLVKRPPSKRRRRIYVTDEEFLQSLEPLGSQQRQASR